MRLALTALGVGPGAEVLTPAFSFVASASTVVMAGATPVFVDIDPETYTLDVAAAERAVTPRTRAIIAVHLYGHPAPMDAVAALARRHGLAVLEDAAPALRATWAGRPGGAGGGASVASPPLAAGGARGWPGRSPISAWGARCVARAPCRASPCSVGTSAGSPRRGEPPARCCRCRASRSSPTTKPTRSRP